MPIFATVADYRKECGCYSSGLSTVSFHKFFFAAFSRFSTRSFSAFSAVTSSCTSFFSAPLPKVLDSIGQQRDAPAVQDDHRLKQRRYEQPGKGPFDSPYPPLGGKKRRIDHAMRMLVLFVPAVVTVRVIVVFFHNNAVPIIKMACDC